MSVFEAIFTTRTILLPILLPHMNSRGGSDLCKCVGPSQVCHRWEFLHTQMTLSIISQGDLGFNMTYTLPDMEETNRIGKTPPIVCRQSVSMLLYCGPISYLTPKSLSL